MKPVGAYETPETQEKKENKSIMMRMKLVQYAQDRALGTLGYPVSGHLKLTLQTNEYMQRYIAHAGNRIYPRIC